MLSFEHYGMCTVRYLRNLDAPGLPTMLGRMECCKSVADNRSLIELFWGNHEIDCWLGMSRLKKSCYNRYQSHGFILYCTHM